MIPDAVPYALVLTRDHWVLKLVGRWPERPKRLAAASNRAVPFILFGGLSEDLSLALMEQIAAAEFVGVLELVRSIDILEGRIAELDD